MLGLYNTRTTGETILILNLLCLLTLIIHHQDLRIKLGRIQFKLNFIFTQHNAVTIWAAGMTNSFYFYYLHQYYVYTLHRCFWKGLWCMRPRTQKQPQVKKEPCWLLDDVGDVDLDVDVDV